MSKIKRSAAPRDLDVLTDDELDAYLDRAEHRPTDRELAGGARPELGWVMTVTGAMGAFASAQLGLAELELARDPLASLSCDINPLVGCSTFLGSWQGALFGVPNSYLGLAFFVGVMALGLVLLSRGTFGRWLWRALAAGVALGVVWLFWFQYQSFVEARVLCPWCVVVWVALIPLAVMVIAGAVQGGHIPTSSRTRRALVSNRWLMVGIWFAALLLFTAIWFWDEWMLVLG